MIHFCRYDYSRTIDVGDAAWMRTKIDFFIHFNLVYDEAFRDSDGTIGDRNALIVAQPLVECDNSKSLSLSH